MALAYLGVIGREVNVTIEEVALDTQSNGVQVTTALFTISLSASSASSLVAMTPLPNTPLLLHVAQRVVITLATRGITTFTPLILQSSRGCPANGWEPFQLTPTICCLAPVPVSWRVFGSVNESIIVLNEVGAPAVASTLIADVVQRQSM